MKSQWLYDLFVDNKPLPNGTRIVEPSGNIHELPAHVLEAANRRPNHMSEHVPFWILGWTDLHDKLLPPTGEQL